MHDGVRAVLQTNAAGWRLIGESCNANGCNGCNGCNVCYIHESCSANATPRYGANKLISMSKPSADQLWLAPPFVDLGAAARGTCELPEGGACEHGDAEFLRGVCSFPERWDQAQHSWKLAALTAPSRLPDDARRTLSRDRAHEPHRPRAQCAVRCCEPCVYRNE